MAISQRIAFSEGLPFTFVMRSRPSSQSKPRTENGSFYQLQHRTPRKIWLHGYRRRFGGGQPQYRQYQLIRLSLMYQQGSFITYYGQNKSAEKRQKSASFQKQSKTLPLPYHQSGLASFKIIIMLRKLTTIATINLINPSSFQPQLHRLPLLFPFSFPAFSTLKPQQVLEDLSKLTTQQEFQSTLIEMSKLNTINRRLCLQSIISRIKHHTLPPYTVVNEKFLTHLKKFPDLHIRTLLIRVNQQYGELNKMIRMREEEGKKIVVKDINTCYSTVFDILKKMPRTEAVGLEIKVYKSFADYHHNYLSNLVEPGKLREVLKKGCDFYRSALGKVVGLIEKEDERAKVLPKEKVELGEIDVGNMTEEKIKELEGNVVLRRFKLVQEYCEVLYKILDIQNYLTDPRIKDQIRPRTKLQIPFMYHEGLYSLIPSFQKGLSFFKDPTDRVESSFYYKIKKSHLQLQHSQRLDKCKDNPQAMQRELQDFDRKMQELTKDIITDIELTPLLKQTVQIYRNLSIILLSIKSNKLARANLTEEEYETRLVEEIRSILAIFKNKDLQKVISASIIGVVQTVMKLDLQKYLGRLPRSTRCKGRKKMV